MIKTIAHLADIHIRKTPKRNTEYQLVFNNLIKSLREKKPDRIVIVGDLVHDYLDLQGEQLIMAHDLLNSLAEIAPVRITRGNHDCRKKNLKRVDSVKAIVETLRNPDVIYYDSTGLFDDENITWVVWHHGEKNNNPWRKKDGKTALKDRQTNKRIYIDLFHDPINGCKSATDFEMKSNSYYKVKDFMGDYSLFGDIHKMQYLNDDKTKAYCSSLIEQYIDEGDDAFHGYLLWDVLNKGVEEVPIHNDYSHKNIRITPYTDFDELDFEIDNPTKFMKVRFIWGTLPQTRSKENERKVTEYIKSQYDNVTVLHKNEFLESEDVEVNNDVTFENITDQAVQQEIFNEYLTKIGTDEDVITDVLALDEEIIADVDIPEDGGIEWGVIKFGGVNFMSYGKLDIDWRDMNGLFQITGINTAGKTTVMKLLTYILYGKTLETEMRVKYGDSRFVNNRNGASFCEGYLVLEANGEYYGIKKRTEIEKKRDGEIKGAPTTLNYYLLADPDEEMTDDNLVENLNEDLRVKTQKIINGVIGEYDNFMRIVMTTSDTLNRILSNDMATFIDSLLFDSGLDIFDKKLEAFKKYQKSVNEKPRINCNVELVNTEIASLNQNIAELEGEIYKLESQKLPDVVERIQKGRDYIEKLTKKLYKIDPEIFHLSVSDVQKTVDTFRGEITSLEQRSEVLKGEIDKLQESYDSERLETLIEKRDNHKERVYQKKLEIKAEERKIADWQHEIEIENGKIFNLKKEGKDIKDEIKELKESKTCPTCGQPLTAEHQEHIENAIKEKEKRMYVIADEIKAIQLAYETGQNVAIEASETNIETIREEIVKIDLEMEDVLVEIGELTNQKNDVDKRKKMEAELNGIPLLIDNYNLKVQIERDKIEKHENSKQQIEENGKIQKGIDAAKQRVIALESEKTDISEDILIKKSGVAEKRNKIQQNKTLIEDFKVQERQDLVMSLYKKCVHRDGIPRLMLSNYVIPRINKTLEDILSISNFKVWLDADDLRPKLVYNNRPEAIIDCIGGSGKERTFASVVLKVGLNQINVKSKPTIFLLDEVMGKLDTEGSVEEFVEILQLIKERIDKILVVEQVHELNPDYLLSVELDDDGISSLTIE
jgi:DNA repair exonuclease SbcCD ATPase subunit